MKSSPIEIWRIGPRAKVSAGSSGCPNCRANLLDSSDQGPVDQR